MRQLIRFSAAVAVFLSFSVLAQTRAPAAPPQSLAPVGRYPSQQVKIIVPFAPGGATDFMARFIAQQLTQRMGQHFVVENRTGAGGIIAIQDVLRAPPDGYTLLVASASYTVNPAIMKLPFDPVADATPVVNMVFGPMALVVEPALPVKTMAEFVAYARARPNKLTFASAGVGNTTHIAMEAFMAQNGLKLVHSPYRGMAPALAGVAGGNAQAIWTDIGSAMGLVAADKLRIIAVGGDKRFALIPNVPTVGEAGFPTVIAGSWQGIFAPKETPPAIVNALNTQVNDVLRSKDVISLLSSRFFTPVGGTPAAFAETVKSDVRRWEKVAREANIKVE